MSRSARSAIVVAALSACLVAVGLIAGPVAQTRAQQRDQDVGPPESEGQRVFREMLEDEARALSLQDTEDYSIIELVDLMMVVRITRLLDLTNDQSVTLFGRMHKYLDDIHRLKWDRGALHYFLRQDIKKDADPEVIREKLDRAIEAEIEIARKLKKLVEESGKQLTPKQEAQLFLFTFDFESEIRRLIEQAEDIASKRHGPISDNWKSKNGHGERNDSTPEREGRSDDR